MHKLILLAALSITILISSCNTGIVYEENCTIPEETWHSKNKLQFNVVIADTLSLHNIYINTRNTNNYPFSNLYLYITTILPSKAIARDTLECILADETGKWNGKGTGSLKSLQILFKKDIRFPETGQYLFIIEQGMRKENLQGIANAGIMIEKIK